VLGTKGHSGGPLVANSSRTPRMYEQCSIVNQSSIGELRRSALRSARPPSRVQRRKVLQRVVHTGDTRRNAGIALARKPNLSLMTRRKNHFLRSDEQTSAKKMSTFCEVFFSFYCVRGASNPIRLLLDRGIRGINLQGSPANHSNWIRVR
jgi:hypothetical protein